MKSQFEIKEKSEIEDILKSVSFGTLALCKDNLPYSLPINFVKIDEYIYFHGKKSGKKMSYIKENPIASFSVVESYSIIPSYFSTKENHACPATHFFKSVNIEGEIEIVKNYDTKVKALEHLMQKLQPQGGYLPLKEPLYKKRIDAVEIFRLKILKVTGKAKLAQHLPKERFEMILDNLEKRGESIDKKTIENMLATREKNCEK